jgi:RNA polymerase sigma factor (sigma-70 family)
MDALARASIKWRSIRANPDPWITKVATNLAIDVLRRRRTTSVLVDSVAPEIAIGEGMDLRRAIDQLPRRQRMTIILRYFSGLSEKETAQALRCSTGTVKQHASRGLAALRLSLGEQSWLTGGSHE